MHPRLRRRQPARRTDRKTQPRSLSVGSSPTRPLDSARCSWWSDVSCRRESRCCSPHLPSTTKSSTPVTVTVCVVVPVHRCEHQRRRATRSLPAVLVELLTPIVTFAVGCDVSFTVNVAVPARLRRRQPARRAHREPCRVVVRCSSPIRRARIQPVVAAGSALVAAAVTIE